MDLSTAQYFEPAASHDDQDLQPPIPHPQPQPAASKDPESTKKRKRDKYAGKACGPCKRRKIKCAGGFPCDPCTRRKRACVENESLDTIETQGSKILEPKSHESIQALHDRLAALESHITSLTRALLPTSPLPETNLSPNGQSPTNAPSAESSGGYHYERGRRGPENSSTSPKDCLSFESGKNIATGRNLGETSVTHALQRVEDRLEELGVPVVERESAPGTPPMTPVPSGVRDIGIESVQTRVRKALETNGIVPDLAKWDTYLEIFQLEVDRLYPFTHKPFIAEARHQLWEIVNLDMYQKQPQDIELGQMVQLLLMLAIGRCTVSTRVQQGEGYHSAGWSLYSAAMDLQGSLLDTVIDDSNPLCSLHTLTLVVIYLMRMDASERAQKVLSLAIIHAQHLGIHLDQTHEDMSNFDSEMFKRVWWCMYVLDRRLSLVLGRPFIIQDTSIRVSRARDFEISTPGSTHGSVLDFFHMDADAPTSSSIVYLNVMVNYSQIAGKVCNTLFGINSNAEAKQHTYEYLDSLVHNWIESVPKPLIFDRSNVHEDNSPASSSLFKPRFLIQLRCLYILIVIRRPARRSQSPLPCNNRIESDAICLDHAWSMINMFSQCTTADGVYGFPFLPYLLEATITMVACLTRLPNLKPRYRDVAETAIAMLTSFSKKSWISGKMARIIYKLGNIIPRLFGSENSNKQSSLGIQSDLLTRTLAKPKSIKKISAETNRREDLNSAHQVISLHERQNSTSTWSTPENAKTVVYHSNTTARSVDSRPQLTEDLDHSVDLDFQSSMMEDFPFELNFGSAASQTISSNQAQVNDKDDFSTAFLGAYDIEWLDELISHDNRLLAFA